MKESLTNFVLVRFVCPQKKRFRNKNCFFLSPGLQGAQEKPRWGGAETPLKKINKNIFAAAPFVQYIVYLFGC
ncbi:MAG: hypothetical protein PHD32_10160 [Eubacteriales bacterium]|nr:hypothetical protein [Eubacteriales bacterium]